jgi:hypothetical protein
MSPQQKATFRRISHAEDELRAIEGMADEIGRIWEEQMPGVVAQIIETTGSGDLMAAIRAGAVDVAPLGERTSTDHAARAVMTATTPREDRRLDPVFGGFIEKVVDIVCAADGFPLLDADAVGLMQSMERESLVVFDGSAAARSSEVDAATRFMAFLPYFPEMPFDEVLDLKRDLAPPLARFRGEMVRLAQGFGRPLDATFVTDVEDAWRQSVAPALADIREALADHGLLRDVASVARGDVTRLISEAGGILAASHANLVNLSNLLTMGAAAAVPTLHTLGKAVNQRMATERDVERQGFYFLHRVGEASLRRA